MKLYSILSIKGNFLSTLFLLSFLFSSCTVHLGDELQVGETTIPLIPLSTPVVIFENNQLMWADIENAGTYQIVKDEILDATETISSFNIDSSDHDGVYKIKALPTGDSNNFKESEFSNEVAVTYATPTALTKPVLNFANNELTWDTVENAGSYQLYKDGVALLGEQTSPFKITETLQDGTYTLEAKIKENSRIHLNSEKSEEVVVVFSAI